MYAQPHSVQFSCHWSLSLQVPLVAYYEAITYEGDNSVDAAEMRAEQAYREEAAEAAKKKQKMQNEESIDLGVSGLRRSRQRQLLFSSDNATYEVSRSSANASRAQNGEMEATTALRRRRRLEPSSSKAAHVSEAVAAARASALAEKEAAVALGWRGARHEARRSKRREKAEEWAQMQARGEVGQAVFRATLEQSLASDDDGTVKQ